MNEDCVHLEDIRDVTPSALGCEECLKTGSPWVHLRLCRTCGHVGCCDDSPNRHATKHFQKTRHPIIEGYDPPEGLGLVLRGRGHDRSQRSRDPAQRSYSSFLLDKNGAGIIRNCADTLQAARLHLAGRTSRREGLAFGSTPRRTGPSGVEGT
jgi:hypothetical protein